MNRGNHRTLVVAACATLGLSDPGAGDDTQQGGQGNDTFIAGPGADTIDGVVTQEGMAAVQKFVATSNESVRRAHLDMSAASTNRFVLGQ